jgi:phosphate transport system substrate-binding protein
VKRSTLTRGAIPAAVVLSFALAACGGDEAGSDDPSAEAGAEATAEGGEAAEGETGSLEGTLVGAGASSQQAGVQAWIAAYNAVQPGVTVNYDPIGSGGGRDAFSGGATDYAGTDAVFDEEERAASAENGVCASGSEVIHLPLYISPVAVVFNLEGVDSLNLSGENIARIFAGEITNWNDPAIADDNPDAELPDLAIVPVHRADESGTTENFVDYLALVAPDVWTYEVSGEWPTDLPGEGAPQTAGVVSAVQAGNGYVGYADASQAGELGVAAVGLDGEFIEYSPEAASALVENSPQVEGAGELDLAFELDRTAEGAYPIGLISYHVACLDYEDDEKASLVKDYLSFLASEEGQQAAADNAGSAPIGEGLREQILTSIDAIQ